ncbi:hypothetical protein FQN55_002382, partial [Onygenales sp. PD_40]
MDGLAATDQIVHSHLQLQLLANAVCLPASSQQPAPPHGGAYCDAANLTSLLWLLPSPATRPHFMAWSVFPTLAKSRINTPTVALPRPP